MSINELGLNYLYLADSNIFEYFKGTVFSIVAQLFIFFGGS